MAFNEEDIEDMLKDDDSNGGGTNKSHCPLEERNFLLGILSIKSRTMTKSLEVLGNIHNSIDLEKKKEIFKSMKEIIAEIKMTITQCDYLASMLEPDDESDKGDKKNG